MHFALLLFTVLKLHKSQTPHHYHYITGLLVTRTLYIVHKKQNVGIGLVSTHIHSVWFISCSHKYGRTHAICHQAPCTHRGCDCHSPSTPSCLLRQSLVYGHAGHGGLYPRSIIEKHINQIPSKLVVSEPLGEDTATLIRRGIYLEHLSIFYWIKILLYRSFLPWLGYIKTQTAEKQWERQKVKKKAARSRS